MTVFFRKVAGLLGVLLALAACGGTATTTSHTPDVMPSFAPLSLKSGERLQVVATSNLVADVVQTLGGAEIHLTALLPIGADPHGYSPTPQDLRAVAGADVIFVNGLGLESFLDEMLTNAGGNPVIVPVSVGINPLAMTDTGDDDHADEADHGDTDPHVWFSVPNVITWTHSIEAALSGLDLAHAADYASRATAYRAQLTGLDQELRQMVAQIPPNQRKLVTDHRAFAYLATEYGFDQTGAVIDSFSTLSQSSAQSLVALQEQIKAAGAKAIFVGSTVNPALADQLAKDLGISVVPVFTGSLSPADGPAATYIDFMRYDMGAIADALK
ncbi:MAG: zinc ABC transporter substrate-binding protein [Caldilineaceae bacterium]|nr:zinc ABC transporter substrate-binding protein [Caldilineaceae bacterium]MBP8110377.1 zinc ABC transporter substrate-binding protein [Caldilineaceae bacterium]MBP8121613.1 zinc ABC transporter substrate-binding protein [Caldilineaceae bacterium]MBP9075071.1 zinc ABC transporter substrate-binding protein [Caldilineaceae bacterium]